MHYFKKLLVVSALLCSFASFSAYSAEPSLNISESVLCESVQNYVPKNIKSSFPNNVGRVYYWTKILGAKEPVMITHQWFYKDKLMVKVPLNIQHEKHRTWSYKTIMPEWTGQWKVKTVDKNNVVLNEKNFVIGKNSKAKSYEQGSSNTNREITEENGIELKFGTAIDKREVSGRNLSFPNAIERVYCWTLVKTDDSPTTVKHVWYYKNRIMSEITLRIKYPRTRTWSYKTILPEQTGNWNVKIFDARDNLLKSSGFEIK